MKRWDQIMIDERGAGRVTHTVNRKLRSRRGASITFALLLFLVCAVISSVIIAAATTASGRLSKQAEMDQRYYSVTSAAELLKDLIDEEAVTIVRQSKRSAVITYNNDVEEKKELKDDETTIYYMIDKHADELDFDMLADALDAYTANNAGSGSGVEIYSVAIDEETGDILIEPTEIDTIPRLVAYTYYLDTFRKTGEEAEDAIETDPEEYEDLPKLALAGVLPATVEVERNGKGDIRLTVYNTVEDAGGAVDNAGKVFIMVLTFDGNFDGLSEINKPNRVHNNDGAINAAGNVTYTMTETTRNISYASFKWSLKDMRVKNSGIGTEEDERAGG